MQLLSRSRCSLKSPVFTSGDLNAIYRPDIAGVSNMFETWVLRKLRTTISRSNRTEVAAGSYVRFEVADLNEKNCSERQNCSARMAGVNGP